MLNKITRVSISLCLLLGAVSIQAGQVTAVRFLQKESSEQGFPEFYREMKKSGYTEGENIKVVGLFAEARKQAEQYGYLPKAASKEEITSYLKVFLGKNGLLNGEVVTYSSVTPAIFKSVGQKTGWWLPTIASPTTKLAEEVNELEKLKSDFVAYKKQQSLRWSQSKEVRDRAEELMRVNRVMFKLSGYATPEQLGEALKGLPAMKQRLQALEEVVSDLVGQVALQEGRVDNNSVNIANHSSRLDAVDARQDATDNQLQQLQKEQTVLAELTAQPLWYGLLAPVLGKTTADWLAEEAQRSAMVYVILLLLLVLSIVIMARWNLLLAVSKFKKLLVREMLEHTSAERQKNREDFFLLSSRLERLEARDADRKLAEQTAEKVVELNNSPGLATFHQDRQRA